MVLPFGTVDDLMVTCDTNIRNLRINPYNFSTYCVRKETNYGDA